LRLVVHRMGRTVGNGQDPVELLLRRRRGGYGPPVDRFFLEKVSKRQMGSALRAVQAGDLACHDTHARCPSVDKDILSRRYISAKNQRLKGYFRNEMVTDDFSCIMCI
jgi:hypothetical protein